MSDVAIYRHKTTGDYFIYFHRKWSTARCVVLVTEEQAEKTAAILGIDIQVTIVPQINND